VQLPSIFSAQKFYSPSRHARFELMQIPLETEVTDLDGVIKIQPSTNFEDFRGTYVEIFNRELFRGAGIDLDFIQDDISISSKGVLRGIHGDSKTWKLISCLSGKFYLVVVDARPDSKQFGKWTSFTLSSTNRTQVLVPPGFGNGHLVLSDEAIFHYKQTTEYDRSSQFTILWNDPQFGIWWPTSSPILSKRDAGLDG
jgi:dTDP-4-dehydrorhamnose 3,5-epimerase